MEISMGLPEWIVIVMIIIATVSKCYQISKLQSKEEITGAAIGTVLYPIVWVGLLYWGGFFH
jgi:hypothetical protein